MRILSLTALVAWLMLLPVLAVCQTPPRSPLDRETNPDRLEAAATAVAASNDASAIADLARRLAQRSFLDRLDPPQGGVPAVTRLARVFQTLGEHPSRASATLCITVADAPEFSAVPVRLNFLLNALAAVRPLSAEAADIFRKTSRSGFFAVNGPLLAREGSPQAIEVLTELLDEESMGTSVRADVAHRAIVPNRTTPSIVSMSAELLRKSGLSREVQLAIVESLYDYQPRVWFGVEDGTAAPPPWSAAPAEAKNMLRALAAGPVRRMNLPPPLRNAVQKTVDQLR